MVLEAAGVRKQQQPKENVPAQLGTRRSQISKPSLGYDTPTSAAVTLSRLKIFACQRCQPLYMKAVAMIQERGGFGGESLGFQERNYCSCKST
jgi:hypothetical protein